MWCNRRAFTIEFFDCCKGKQDGSTASTACITPTIAFVACMHLHQIETESLLQLMHILMSIDVITSEKCKSISLYNPACRLLELLQALLDNGSPDEVTSKFADLLPVLERLVQSHATSVVAAQSSDWEAEEHMHVDHQLPTETGATHALNCLNVGPRMTPIMTLTQEVKGCH